MQKGILVPGARTSPFRSRAELNQYARASVGGALTKTYQLSRSLWLLHMRPLQLCIKSQVPQNALRTGTLRIKMTRGCLIPWRNMTLYRLWCSCWLSDPENECYDKCIESGSCGAICDGRPAFGTWSEIEKSWHINCQELRAVHLVFECFLPDILHHHVLIRTDSMTVEAYINHQGGVNSVCVNIYETSSLICKAWWRWCHGMGMHGCLWNSPSQLYWWLNVWWL